MGNSSMTKLIVGTHYDIIVGDNLIGAVLRAFHPSIRTSIVLGRIIENSLICILHLPNVYAIRTVYNRSCANRTVYQPKNHIHNQTKLKG